MKDTSMKNHRLLGKLIYTIFKSSAVWPLIAILLAIGTAAFTSAQVVVFANFTDAAVNVVRNGAFSGKQIVSSMAHPVGILLLVLAVRESFSCKSSYSKG